MSRRRLTERQKTRIRQIQNQRRAAASQRAESLLEQTADAPRAGLVITRHGNNLWVEDENGALHRCLFRQNIGHVVCGDQVVWQPSGDHQGVVTALQPRRSVLSRPDFNGTEKPLAANIEQLIVVIATRPKPVPYLLDQYLVAAENLGLEAAIALNKADLLDQHMANETLDAIESLYPGLGYPLVRVDTRREAGPRPLLGHLRDKTSILVGQSGVGKSSLINALLPDRSLQTQHLDKSGHGRHTTSSTTLYHLPLGGNLIDSPGVRSFRLGRIGRRALERGFVEMREFLGHCRFSDCTHTHEPGCALRQAVTEGRIHPQRLDNLIHMAEHL